MQAPRAKARLSCILRHLEQVDCQSPLWGVTSSESCRATGDAPASVQKQADIRSGEALLQLLERGELRDGSRRVFAKELESLPSMTLRERSALYELPLLDASSSWKFRRFGPCILAEDTYRLLDSQLEERLRSIIAAVVEALQAIGQPVTLSRFDLFHGHLVMRLDGDNRGDLALLLHAAEYPQYSEKRFPVRLGYCQEDSTLEFSEARMRWRNVVVLLPRSKQVKAFALDAESQLVSSLLPEYARSPLYTMYEDILGKPVADVYFLQSKEANLGFIPRMHGLFTEPLADLISRFK
eukprot:TRINITY_DN11925_c0_g1_i1.p1 TRINITY_DN11925_c0_g1~~TRINITY_DN11925_c0_g1_i1.p1  ORF type:complete len:296 (+),score=60.74 TRINITY_DN11925_c0_g1_i1:213-1100(+)